MKPHSHEEHIQHTFDAFCKKVLRNEARDYLDEQARKRNREISFSDLPVEVMEQLSTCDIYFVEKQLSITSSVHLTLHGLSKKPAIQLKNSKRRHSRQAKPSFASMFS